MKTHWTLEEVLDMLEHAGEAMGPAAKEVVLLIMHIERLFYNKHIDEIRKRQENLEKLWVDKSGFLAVWCGIDDYVIREIDGETVKIPALTKGCQSCLFGLISHVRHSYKCTQNCSFCYYAPPDTRMVTPIIGKGMYGFSGVDMTFTLEEAKLLLDRQLSSPVLSYDAIGWLQREPLEELESLIPIMEHIAKKGMWQYLYTNGVRASIDAIDKLADCGLNEIRYNLMGTHFSSDVFYSMKYAATKIEKVCIETPIYSKTYKLFKKTREQILDTGVYQINLPELQVISPTTVPMVEETEGHLYKHRRGNVSPVSSRHYAYDLIELAEAEKWPVLINDCSNDTKYYRGAASRLPLGTVDYRSQFELSAKHVAWLANQVMEPGEVYEFF
jgi:pyruvate formate-lyase activating enzyme-like uncharacterized protein